MLNTTANTLCRLSMIMAALLSLASCTHKPDNIEAVSPFAIDRFLGQWFEIARLAHSFERGLSHVTANYSLQADGTIKVVNRGYDQQQQSWNTATGKAKFVGDSNTGHFKVSFFGPFYGAYVVFKLDPDYQYAYVTSYNRDFLWLLSREATISEARKQDFIETAKALGFDTEALIFVAQANHASLNQAGTELE